MMIAIVYSAHGEKLNLQVDLDCSDPPVFHRGQNIGDLINRVDYDKIVAKAKQEAKDELEYCPILGR